MENRLIYEALSQWVFLRMGMWSRGKDKGKLNATCKIISYYFKFSAFSNMLHVVEK